MKNHKDGDLKINGLGSAGGGKYNFVEINGKGDISGNIECADLEINGFGSIEGDVKTDTAHIAGKSDISGNVEARDFSVDGVVEIAGGVKAERLQNHGAMQIGRDCGAEEFKSRGGFAIGGLLNSGKIDVELYAHSSAREIGGENISVRQGEGFGFKKFINSILPGFGWKSGLEAETIEGDDVYLEHTKSKVVRGQNVRIGPGCEIDLVEYKNTFEKSSDAIVKSSKKV